MLTHHFQTDDSALLDDTDAKGRDKNGSLDEDESMDRPENETRKFSRGLSPSLVTTFQFSSNI